MTERTTNEESTTAEERTDRNADGETMADVSHTPPQGVGANRVWDGTRVYEHDATDERVRPRDEDDE